MQTLQPCQEQVLEIVVKINVKMIEFKVTQTTVVSLLEEQPTIEVITATRESVDQMMQDIATLQERYTKVSKEIWNTMKGPKDDIGGLRTSH